MWLLVDRVSFTGGDDVRVEEVASADFDCVESSFADEAADGLDVELPTGGVFGDCYCVIFSVHRSYYITRRIFLQSVSRRCVTGNNDIRRSLGHKKMLNRGRGGEKKPG